MEWFGKFEPTVSVKQTFFSRCGFCWKAELVTDVCRGFACICLCSVSVCSYVPLILFVAFSFLFLWYVRNVVQFSSRLANRGSSRDQEDQPI